MVGSLSAKTGTVYLVHTSKGRLMGRIRNASVSTIVAVGVALFGFSAMAQPKAFGVVEELFDDGESFRLESGARFQASEDIDLDDLKAALSSDVPVRITFRRGGGNKVATAIEALDDFQSIEGEVSAIDDAARKITVGGRDFDVEDYLDLSALDVGDRVRVLSDDDVVVDFSVID